MYVCMYVCMYVRILERLEKREEGCGHTRKPRHAHQQGTVSPAAVAVRHTCTRASTHAHVHVHAHTCAQRTRNNAHARTVHTFSTHSHRPKWGGIRAVEKGCMAVVLAAAGVAPSILESMEFMHAHMHACIHTHQASWSQWLPQAHLVVQSPTRGLAAGPVAAVSPHTSHTSPSP